MITTRKARTAYFCAQCGTQHAKWQGQCRGCGQWNSLVEERVTSQAAIPTGRVRSEKRQLPQIELDADAGSHTGIAEFDNVLGGRLLPAMTVLLGGEPGIGKSTLLLQVAEAFSRQNLPVAYISGEESLGQIKLRARRLGIQGSLITVANTGSVEEIVEILRSQQFTAAFVDSIQTMASSQLESPPGSVGQVRDCADQLIKLARQQAMALVLVGHVTKEGMVAGPKVLEHIVDTVVYFEGDSAQQYRILRAVKNRFGSISEIGLFEMHPGGLLEVPNPSSFFLAGHSMTPRTGSVVTAVSEGNRSLLVEVQALATSATYATPQRVAAGIDGKRLALLLAILERRGGFPTGGSDVFVSIAGGLKFSQPSLDLPVAVAIASSLTDKPIDPGTLVLGEIGLSGEVRGVAALDRRLSEARKLGFKTAVLPKANRDSVKEIGVELIAVDSLQAALDILIR